MTDVYTYFYSINTNAKDRTEEILIDFNALADFEKALCHLPEVSPSDTVVKRILELA